MASSFLDWSCFSLEKIQKTQKQDCWIVKISKIKIILMPDSDPRWSNWPSSVLKRWLQPFCFYSTMTSLVQHHISLLCNFLGIALRWPHIHCHQMITSFYSVFVVFLCIGLSFQTSWRYAIITSFVAVSIDEGVIDSRDSLISSEL